MPYSSEHLAYTFSGSLPGGEIWSCTLRTAASAIVDPNALNSYAAQASDIFKAQWNGTNGLKFWNPNTVNFTKTTVRHITVAGLTDAQADFSNTGAVGANPVQSAPNQGTTVLSLLTARAGRSFRGRIYLPTLSPEWVLASGRMSNAMVSGLAVNQALLITDLNAMVTTVPSSGPFVIAIQSKTSGAPPAPVDLVKIGDVLDTQRRRRDKLIENYTSVGV